MKPHQYPPGPPGGLFGLQPTAEFVRDPLAFVTRLPHDYGDIIYHRFGPYDLYQVHHPDLVRQVLVTDAKKFHKWDRIKKVFGKAANGLFIDDGDHWRQHRKLAQPAFHTRRIGHYADIIVQKTQLTIDSISDGQPFDMLQKMTELAMRVIAKVLFDADLDEKTHPIALQLGTIIEMLTLESMNLLHAPDWMPTPRNLRENKALHDVRAFLMEIIVERRTSGVDNGDLLSALVFTQDEDGNGLSDVEVYDEIVTLFLAGHDTTANGLAWLWYLLSGHPEAQATLYAEVTAVLNGRVPTLADLAALTYTEMCFKEAMRFYPPVWLIQRQAVEPVEIAGYTIAPGSVVQLSPWALHHDSRYWDDSLSFKPERFTKQGEHQVGYAYVPFGAGPRVCIGEHLAMMEAKIVTAMLTSRFKLEVVQGQTVIPEAQITLRPKDGLMMRALTLPGITE
ncbi:MAG: cytochrome P450 [Anaerolineae bacterium]